MPRKPRLVVPRVPHNVGMRGNNRRRLFSSHSDRLHFVRCLIDGLRESGCSLHQLTLMSNHVHLIATPPTSDALSWFVARTCQPYAQRRNAARDGSGKLFEQRFYSRTIEDEAALVTITLYNDANGFRQGLADLPFGHAWSTGPFHAGVGKSYLPPTLWTPSRSYLALGASPAARAEAYRELMAVYTHGDRGAVTSAPVDRADVYSKRLERPDGSSARERALQWCRKP